MKRIENCPHCGGKCNIVIKPNHRNSRRFRSGDDINEAQDKAIDAWNMRTGTIEDDEIVAVVTVGQSEN